MGGGGLIQPRLFIYFFTKKLSPRHRHTCKFLILAIFYHAKKNPEDLVHTKFDYIKKINTVHNLITFSIVFTNKNVFF